MARLRLIETTSILHSQICQISREKLSQIINKVTRNCVNSQILRRWMPQQLLFRVSE